MILHSCDGLILCKHSGTLIVLNPTTQKYRLLPDFSSYFWLRHCSSDFFLAFETSKPHYYKVVVLELNFFVHIFSSESGSWKSINTTGPPPGESCTRRIFWNGAIHWMQENNLHVKFDVDAEMIIVNRLPLKPIILPPKKIQYFGECDGRLILVQNRQSGAQGFRILEMDRDSSCWETKHQINLRPLASEFPEMHVESDTKRFDYSMLYVKSGANRENLSLVLAIPRKVVLYEVKKGKNQTKSALLSEFFISQGLARGERYSICTHSISQCLVPI